MIGNIGKTLFQELEAHLMEDEKPSQYLTSIKNVPELREYPFNMLACLQDTPQSPLHHPEGNVWNHTLLVVDEAAKAKGKSKNPAALMWAALLHDLGKPSTTRNRKGKITSYDHDKAGAALAGEYLAFFSVQEALIRAVTALVRYHMQPLFVCKGLPFADLEGMVRDADAQEVALLALCDRYGRTGADRRKEREDIRLFLEHAGKYNTRLRMEDSR